MQIAIIGAGSVARSLASSFKRAGHDVVLATRNAQGAAAVAQEIGVRSAGSPAEAVRDAEVVILAVPYTAVEAVGREIAPLVAGKIVVDPTNPVNATGTGLATEGGPSAAERIAGWVPGASVVKAFNTLLASLQADPTRHESQLDALIAGDDARAKARVAELVRSIGFRPVDAGPLARARELESLAFLNISLQILHGGDWQSAWTLVGAPAGATSAGEREPATHTA